MAHDDWRVSVTLADEGGGLSLFRRMPEMHFADEVRDRLGGRLSVSREGRTVFVYADAEGPAREAERAVRDELAEEGITAETVVTRWHPVEQKWLDPGTPMPDAAEVAREHEREEDEEAADALAHDAPTWEVRLELADRDAAAEMAERLEGEGIPVTRHHRYLLVGALNQDHAEDLSARLKAEAPAGSEVHIEPSGLQAWEVRPPNPFAIFGGLGG